MALFNTLETETNSPPSSRLQNPAIGNFSILNALPQSITVRNTKLQIIFQNKAAQQQHLPSGSTFTSHKELQQTIRQKALVLFDKTKNVRAQNFEVEVEDLYLKVHQTLEERPSGEMVIVESIKENTDKKVNDVVLQLLSANATEQNSANYLNNLTRQLATLFHVDMAMVSMTNPSRKESTTLSCWIRGAHVNNFTYRLSENPYSRIHEIKEPLLISQKVQALFPGTTFLKTYNFDAFYGVPLINPENKVIGVISIAHSQRIKDFPFLKMVINKLIAKLTLEVSTKRYLQKLEIKKLWTRQAVNSYQDPFAVFDKNLSLRAFNVAYETTFEAQHQIKVKKGMQVLDEIAKRIQGDQDYNNTITLEEITTRKSWLQKAFDGEQYTDYVVFENKNNNTVTHYSFSFYPIYNFEKTEVREVLMITNNITALIKSQRELERVKRHYFSIFENTMLGIGIYDSINERWMDFNDQFLNLFGATSKEESLQYKPGALSPEYQPNGVPSALLLKKMEERLKKNVKFTTSWTHSRFDGTEFPSETSFIPLDDEQPGLFCIAIKNMSEYLAQQKTLEEKNHKLEQYIKSNMELENLAYSACHDLKEPLRTIGTFTQIIKNKYEDVIDEKSKEYMSFIVNGVTRMNHFVDGLFAYSRVRENQNNFENFSLTQLLAFIQLDLNQNILEKCALIQLVNIPESIKANRTKIKQLFQNLIANAIKFQHPEVTPKIKVTCSDTDSHWSFSVEDNGIGINKDYHEQIFTLFRKLHSKDQYEGSGIGLALCKEIVEQHGGSIQVQSEQGKGTTFIFTIDKKL